MIVNKLSDQKYIESVRKRFSKRCAPPDANGCIIWMGATARGYGTVYVDGKQHRAHRVAWFLENGRLPLSNEVACHSCDVPQCVNAAHIFLGTQQDNMKDMWAKGRVNRGNESRGEDHYNSSLSEENVRRIRELIASGVQLTKISKDFNVSRPTISAIKHGRNWGWLV